MDYITTLRPERMPEWPRSISVLGSTGSIGTNALNIVRRYPEDFRVVALAGARNIPLLAEQAAEFRPLYLGVLNTDSVHELKRLLPSDYRPGIVCGTEGYSCLAGLGEAEMVLCAQVGASGLLPAHTAASEGKIILLANKEALVLGGSLLREQARRNNAVILPVDSEHNALFQCLDADSPRSLSRLILTASGGPFRTWKTGDLSRVTPEHALNHPNWSMGAKISVDSATLMNKGLEVIEAYHLFGVDRKKISVVVHPQSIIHSLVEYTDSSMLAHMGLPDMQAPIAYCLSFPCRLELGLERLDLARIGELNFEEADSARFPCLDMALQCLEGANSLPVVLNAANEVAVQAFLDRKIAFMQIAQLVKEALNAFPEQGIGSIEEIFDLDNKVRGHLQEKQEI